MPSGGGSAGGGGGGGGGRSWNFSRSYSYGYTKRYRREAHYSSDNCDCCGSSCCKCIGIPLVILLPGLGIFFIFSLVIVAVSLGALQYGLVSPLFFSPGDTRIVSFGSSSFCAGVTLRDQSIRVGSSLYLITDTPELTDQNNFTNINNKLTIADNNYRYWSYYLYPNSGFTLELCTLPDSAGGVFYLIKGKTRFDKWVEEPTTDLAVGFFSIGPLPCSEPRHRFSFQAEYEDDYYLVYFNNNHYTNRQFLRLNLTMSFYRFEYSTEDLESVANCSVATTGECTVPVPYGSNYRALIVTDIPEDPDWEENVDVSWRCADRTWAYATVILVPMAVVGTIIGTIVTIIFCILGRYKYRRYQKRKRRQNQQTSEKVNNEPTDESKSPELPPAEPTDTSEDDFKSVDPS